MSKPYHVLYTCPRCDNEFRVKVLPGCEAQTYGPPENCYPAEADEFDPEYCPKCDTEIDPCDIDHDNVDDEIYFAEKKWELDNNR